MIATRGMGAGYGTLPPFGMGAGFAAAPPVAPASSKGRRIARWILSAPSIENPIGAWIRQREDEEILFL